MSDRFDAVVVGTGFASSFFLHRFLAGAGPALEFAVGTGRVAVPLRARGVPVTGIELSEPMVAQLRRKVDESALPVVVGDMATTTVPGEFSLVYLVWNTIGNLRTQDEQVACFAAIARMRRSVVSRETGLSRNTVRAALRTANSHGTTARSAAVPAMAG